MNSEEKLSQIKMSRYERLPTRYTIDEIKMLSIEFKKCKSDEYNVELLSDFIAWLGEK